MKTLIVDNYDSFTFNLVQMVAAINREYPVVVRNDQLTWSEFEKLNVDQVIISPGPGRPENERDFGICRQIILEARVPILGVCLGLQGMAYLFGGRIIRAPEPVHGRTSPIFHSGTGIFDGIPQGFRAVRYHSLIVSRPVPECLKITGWTEDQSIMGIEHRVRPFWGVQFHPESICTEYGEELLRNFRRLTAGSVSATSGAGSSAPRDNVSEPAWTGFHRKLDLHPSPEETFHSLFADHQPAFWLDATDHEANQSRFSFMGSVDPQSFWVSYFSTDKRLVIHSGDREEVRNVGLFEYMQAELHRRRVITPGLPFDFNGGFVGYLGYELKAECEGAAVHASPHPDACLIFADRLLAFDHQERVVYLVYAGADRDPDSADVWFNEMERRLRFDIRKQNDSIPRSEAIHFRLEQSRTEYLDNIDRCLQLIRDGESYEICLTNRLSAETTVDPLRYYDALRQHNPAPHAAFLQFNDVSVTCTSPERFLKIDPHGGVEAKPIKGTVRRSPNEVEDIHLRERLRTSVKTRSENLMIVDLLRHDLGRTCEVGSVHVPQMMHVETYRNLHQLVSTVRGRLRPDVTAIDCVRSAFPGGSMTGAPKLRTMELIDQLERSPRGVYSGAIGFFALNGAADLNVVIRTAVFSGGRVEIGVGGAIVALSDPEAEFEETILKGRALLEAFGSVVTGAVTIEGEPILLGQALQVRQ